MTQPVKITPRSRAIDAPDWVAEAIDGAAPIGRGSYAKVFACKDGSALKITSDRATMSLAAWLSRRPLPGVAAVSRASRLRKAPRPSMAVSMQLLCPLNEWQAASVRIAYDRSLLAACSREGFKGATIGGARRFACALACSNDAAQSEFSAILCTELAARCLPNEQGSVLRRALIEIAAFCVSRRVDVDLMGTDNWMLDARGRLVLSDPVVLKAYRF